MSINKTNSIGLMRELIDGYNHKEIEQCIESQINNGCNTCLQKVNDADAVSILAKAGFIHSLLGEGYNMKNALRELGKRMRFFQ